MTRMKQTDHPMPACRASSQRESTRQFQAEEQDFYDECLS